MACNGINEYHIEGQRGAEASFWTVRLRRPLARLETVSRERDPTSREISAKHVTHNYGQEKAM